MKVQIRNNMTVLGHVRLGKGAVYEAEEGELDGEFCYYVDIGRRSPVLLTPQYADVYVEPVTAPEPSSAQRNLGFYQNVPGFGRF